jgi:Protein of unknown function (DUF1559)
MTTTSLKRLVAPLTTAAMLVAIACFAAPVPKEPTDPRKDSESAEAAEPAIDPDKLKDDADLRVKDAANRVKSTGNLKQIALAFHNYADSTQGRWPNNVTDQKREPLLSWRVLLLPYLEEVNLYKQFKLDEPWNGPNNSKLIEKMPKVFDSPRVILKRKGYTVYQGFAGPNTAFPPGKQLRFPGSFPDGTSNTLLVVEASTAVPWTKPADIPFDPAKDLPDFGKAFGNRPSAALCDGSVRILDLKKISATTLKNAITTNDGMILGNDW